jgi:hypothetical protein
VIVSVSFSSLRFDCSITRALRESSATIHLNASAMNQRDVFKREKLLR